MPNDLPLRPDQPARADMPTWSEYGDQSHGWDPVLAEGIRLSDFEMPEADWLDQPTRPPGLDEVRPYDEPGGLAQPDPMDQAALEDAIPKRLGVPERFPDPRHKWLELVNDGGACVDPFRSNNCLDCSLAAISTWYGEPRVSAPRFPERDTQGWPMTGVGEEAGPVRAELWLGAKYQFVGYGPWGYAIIEQKLLEAGHGSSATIITQWPEAEGAGAHAWNAFNRLGEISWCDPQLGWSATEPLYANVESVWAIVLDREGNPR